MNSIRFGFPLLVLTLVGSLCLLLSSHCVAQELPKVKPAEVGLSAERLAKVDASIGELVEKKRLAGAIVAIARHGKVAKLKSYGMLDIEAKKPMRDDAIMRFYSMTKAITSAATLMLVDDGKLRLDDPVSKHISEFRGLKVLSDDKEVDAEREMTVADLLRHTSGLTYGTFGNSRVEKQYQAADVLAYNSTLEDMTAKLAKLPLAYQPAKGWMYSSSIDVAGRVVEIVSGKKLDAFLQDRIFTPLDMRDTGFFVPAGKLDRYAQVYNSDDKGTLTVGNNTLAADFTQPRAFLSGGGGLVSTARDYLRFLVMIQNGGELFGKRILSKESIRLMTTNQLPSGVQWIQFGTQVRQGVGFGLGFSVRVEDSDWDPRGRIGEYGWGGLASTHYWVSPQDDLVVIVLEQTLPYSFLSEFAVKGLIYDAIEKP